MRLAITPWIVVALALAPAILAQTPAPPPSTGDLALVELTLDGPAPQVVHGVGTTHTLHARVQNLGPNDAGPYRLNYEWISGGQRTWLFGDEASSFDVQENPTPQNGHRDHFAAWSPSAAQSGAGRIRVSIQPVGDPNSTNDAWELDLGWVPIHQLSLSVTGPAQDIRPQETRFVRVVLVNQGNLEEIATLRLPNASVGMAQRLDEALSASDLRIPAGAQQTVTLFVTYPFTGDASPFSLAYDVQALTTYGRTLSTNAPTLTGRHDALPPPSPLRLERLDRSALHAAAGTDATLRFAVTNLGTDADVYRIAAQAETGWLLEPSVEQVGLFAGESVQFDALLGFPNGAAAGAASTANLDAGSHRSSQSERIALPLSIAGPRVQLQAPQGWPSSPYVGDPAVLRVTIRNEGDAPTSPDGQIALEAAGIAASPITRSVPVSPLAAGAQRALDIDLGTFTAGTSITLDAAWESPSTPTTSNALRLQGLVHAPTILVQAPPPLTGVPGESVSYAGPGRMFRVSNQGNAPETLNVSVLGHDSIGVLDAAYGTLQLAPGETRTIPTIHVLPRPAGAATHANLSLHAQLVDRPERNWTAQVTTGVRDARAPEIFLATRPTEWARGAALPLQVRTEDDGLVVRVRVTHTAPSGAARTLALASTDGTNWAVHLEPAETGNHSLSLEAWDAAGHAAKAVQHGFHVASIPPPRLKMGGPAEAEVVPANQAFVIEANDTRPLVLLELRILDEGRQVLHVQSLIRNETGHATFNLSGIPSGRVGLHIQATNDAGASTTLTRSLIIAPPPREPIATPAAAATSAKDQPAAKSPGAGPHVAFAVLALAAAGLRRGLTARSGTRKPRPPGPSV